ncbi:MAG: hypothetical protein ACREKE_02910 [bacterium]
MTLLSAPFTALWCGLVAGLAECVIQRKIPPKFGTAQYELVGTMALAGSVSIALVSVGWGGPSRPKASADATTNPLSQSLPNPVSNTARHAPGGSGA